MSELPGMAATAGMPAPRSVRVVHGSGRLHDQPASFMIAAGDRDRAIWVAATADGRAETAIVEAGGATATSWSIGARHTLELEDLEGQIAIVHALTGAGLAGNTLELPSTAGTQRLTLGPARVFADNLSLPPRP